MKRAKKIIRAFETLQVIGLFVVICSAKESADIATNIITCATGAFMVVVGKVICWYIRELGR